MEPSDTASLLPMLTLTVGDTEIKPLNMSDMGDMMDLEDPDMSPNDPNRFNAYLNRGSELWTHWAWLGGQGKMSLMRCNYCVVNKQLKNAPKCRRHLIKCPKTPEIVRKYFEKKEIEATRVSALMRELRSKEIKFPRSEGSSNNNNKPSSDQKLPVPTANDLKHLQHKQHQASLNNGIVNCSSPEVSLSETVTKLVKHNNSHNQLLEVDTGKANIFNPLLSNHKVKGEHTSSSTTNGSNISRNDNNLFNELSFFYQQLMSGVPPPLTNACESIDLSKSHTKNGHFNGNGSASSKLKRKLSPCHDAQSGTNGSNTNKENKEHLNSSLKNTTVVINLDDVNPLDESMFFNPIENGSFHTPIMNGSRKKKRDSSSTNGYSNGRHESKNGGGEMPYRYNSNNISNSNGHSNGFHADFANFNSSDLAIVHDDMNDLLASALISGGIEFDFVANPYFQKFIAQLVTLSGSSKNYRLPSVDKLSVSNINNLIRKFDFETTKIFSDCDSIIVSFDWHKESVTHDSRGSNTTSTTTTANNVIRDIQQAHGKGGSKLSGDLDVNLLISSSNVYSQLFYKKISFLNKNSVSPNDKASVTLDDNLKSLNNQIDSLLNKIGPDRINAVILPYDGGANSSELIYSYLSACHSHIVPLTNLYQLFHHLLCDICKIPSIHKLITQCINLFRELAFNSADFQEENQNHWKRVFESDNLKIYKHFLKECSSFSTSENTCWISLNLMLCWFLVAKTSITELFSSCTSTTQNDDAQSSSSSSAHHELNALLDTINLDVTQIEQFFNQISVLFNFLTPFINAIHLIEKESAIISDLIKIYFDVKLTTTNNNYFDGISVLCDRHERRSLDCILHNYLQEQNLSRFFFLAYYLDPRFRSDKRIEENEDLIAQVYDTLFSYASALGCVNNEEEDREALADSLDEFRTGDKLYGMHLLKCPKSPIKFWKHLRRFPTSAKLAYCATRLLSISTRAMLLTAPLTDKCISTLSHKILTGNEYEKADSKASEKILPIKSYLLSHCEKMPTFEDEEGKTGGEQGTNNCSDRLSPFNDTISNIISNVITSLDQYSLIIAQPFTSTDLSCLLQNSN